MALFYVGGGVNGRIQLVVWDGMARGAHACGGW